jgi:L-alanine-DL-glutamate epimerase-like enolase superfamily enzyme
LIWGLGLKIIEIEPILCDGGYRVWTFVKISTDEGIVGYGDCTCWESVHSVVETIKFLSYKLIGEDPKNIERLYWKMVSRTRGSWGGIAHKAISGIDSALWDIKGKLAGVPVYDLLGGLCRDKLRLYWSHCGTIRYNRPDLFGKSINSFEDIVKIGEEVVRSDFTALKTNIFDPGIQPNEMDRPSVNQTMDNEDIRLAVKMVKTFREAVGEDVDICLDIGNRGDVPSAVRLARDLEQFNLLFLEEPLLMGNPEACLALKNSTRTPICMSEGLYGTNGFRRFLELQAIDIAMPDFAWNGVSMGKKIANQCETYYIPVAPHNCFSPLTTIISGHISASINNFIILEFDVDDVPWRDKVISKPLKIDKGYLRLSKEPGYGVDLDEDEINRHPPSQKLLYRQ